MNNVHGSTTPPRLVASVFHAIGKRDLDEWGSLTHDAENRVWQAAAGLPPGADFHLDVGPARYPTRRVLDFLLQAMSSDSTVHLSGPRADVVLTWHQAWCNFITTGRVA